jgi:hypothetical protein
MIPPVMMLINDFFPCLSSAKRKNENQKETETASMMMTIMIMIMKTFADIS